jgi:hypothetical protein
MNSKDIKQAMEADRDHLAILHAIGGPVLLVLGCLMIGQPGLVAVIGGTLFLAKAMGVFRLSVIQQYHVDADVHPVDDGDAWKSGSIDDDDDEFSTN